MQILTYEDRKRIEWYLKLRLRVSGIAKSLRRDKSVVTRELKRNTKPGKKYSAVVAQRLADFRSRKTNTRKLEADQVLHDYVVARLKDDWSPELIAGTLKHEPPSELGGRYVNHESIYQYIYEGEGRFEGLFHLLVRKRPKRRKKQARKPRKIGIPERVSIHERPEEVNTRSRFGDWETDSMQFRKQKAGLSVQYERKGMLTFIHLIKDKTAEETKAAITTTMESVPEEWRKTITYDNGTEGVKHTEIRDLYNIQTYFCDSYASWQKGGVENTNGIIRRFLPKDADLSKITEEDIFIIQEKINNRPRKKLRYKTPNGILSTAINQSTGALNC